MRAPCRQSVDRRILESFAKQSVLVIGDLMLDEHLYGDVRRLSPEAPVPVLEVRSRIFRPGGAAHVAASVASLGAHCILGGVVGRDDSAMVLLADLESLKVSTSGVRSVPGRWTTTKTRICAGKQQIVRVDCEQTVNLARAVEDDLIVWLRTIVPTIDACIISDYGKGVASPRVVKQCIRCARQSRKPIVIDPKSKNLGIYRGATLLKPNKKEVERATGLEIRSEQSLIDVAQIAHQSVPESMLLITCDRSGMLLLQPGCEPMKIEAKACKECDATGAGDTVACIMAVGLAAGLCAADAAYVANVGGGIAVQKTGVTRIMLAELIAGCCA